MVLLQSVIGLLFCLGSFAQEHSILDHSQLNDVIEELKLLRKEVGENRKLILKHESELRAVKLELEETKRQCYCEPTPAEKKSKSEMNMMFSNGENTRIRKSRQSRIRRIIPPTNPTASHNEPIAFYAYMNAPMGYIGGHHTLIFDVIKCNSGLGLHPTTGVFIAPTSGFYVFIWSIRVYDNSSHGVELIVNGQAVGAMYLQSGAGDNDTGSTTVVVHVNEGEDVFLRTTTANNGGVIYSNNHGRSSFTGWMLT